MRALVGAGIVCGALLACSSFDSNTSVPAPPSEDAASDAALEAAPPSDAATNDVVVLPGKLVFVTKVGLAPNGAGAGFIAAANTLCKEEAAKAQMTGTFVAWLSTTTEPVGLKIQSNGPWVLRTGDLVFADRKALFTADIKKGITMHADGLGASKATVWTGTKLGGDTAANCSDWTDTNPTAVGTAGVPDDLNDGHWTYGTSELCGSLRPVYCFED